MHLATQSAKDLDRQMHLQQTGSDDFLRAAERPLPRRTASQGLRFQQIGKSCGRAAQVAASAFVLVALGPALALMGLVRLLHELVLEEEKRAEELRAWESEMRGFDRF